MIDCRVNSVWIVAKFDNTATAYRKVERLCGELMADADITAHDMPKSYYRSSRSAGPGRIRLELTATLPSWT